MLVADIGASGHAGGPVQPQGRARPRSGREIDIADGPDRGARPGAGRRLRAAPATRDRGGWAVSLPGPVEFADRHAWLSRRSWRDGTAPGVPGTACSFRRQRASSRTTSTRWPWASSAVAFPTVAGRASSTIKVGTGIGSRHHLERRPWYEALRARPGTSATCGPTQTAGGWRRAAGCQCGKEGCVEAYASGWAIVRDLAAARPAGHDRRPGGWRRELRSRRPAGHRPGPGTPVG